MPLTDPRHASQLPADDTDTADRVFAFKPATGDQGDRYDLLRRDAAQLWRTIAETTPECPDSARSRERLRESIMWAETAIMLEPTLDGELQRTCTGVDERFDLEPAWNVLRQLLPQFEQAAQLKGVDNGRQVAECVLQLAKLTGWQVGVVDTGWQVDVVELERQLAD